MSALSSQDFLHIVKHTPLVSIDLIIVEPAGHILLGKRINSPARGYWFVPGGRIRKDEKFADAFTRIAMNETGLDVSIDKAEFMGVYEHIYPGENYTNEAGFGTHYIVNAYRIMVDTKLHRLPREQHTDYWWASENEINYSPNVHQNTKNYFNDFRSFGK
jgi:colanic acid biosynthesis protein WcaH